MNRVVLMGRLTRDPDIRQSQSGTQIARFTLAINRMKEGADYINCIAFDKKAEVIEKYVQRGHRLLVEGHIQTGSYEGKNGKVYTTDVIVDNLEFVESKNADSGVNNEGFMSVPDDVNDEGLPFA